ncbi:MAG: hypothetical protein D6741_12350, partial [Planctomycetota bacterium]
KEGRVGGTFFDRMLDQAVPVTGDVDRDTMTLRWKIGENGGVFESSIDAIAQPEASVTVHLPDGAAVQWRLVKRR